MPGNIVSAALEKLFSASAAAANFASLEKGLDIFGERSGLDKPHRTAHYLAQLSHESGGFVFDREVWGPTPAQSRYDTRVDLGNTPVVDGDGKLYRGRTAIQVTGTANYQALYGWCMSQGLNPPDFVTNPDLLNTDPWEGLAPVWYWSTHNLNKLADANDIEQITKKINGGLNGFADRLAQYTRIGLVMLGFAPTDIRGFQTAAIAKGFDVGAVDGDAGPKTRSAIHQWLASFSSVQTTFSPVVQEKPVAVAPKGADKTGVMRFASAVAIAAPAASPFIPSTDTAKLILVAIGVVAVIVLLWRGELIASRVKAVIGSFEG
jgi:putative chitinase